ncbi:MAG: succinyl-CoA--3-ketoacid-CoA transferase, partial [Acholeplasmataceae bacterium]|nr:succinyl-CoA--3-ketoacid-CoA transferase [Acholeplasmataceae bacterium]
MNAKEIIAKRIAKELKNGDVVNLGIGVPSLVADYIPKDVTVYLQSENGIIGLGPLAEADQIDEKLTNPS